MVIVSESASEPSLAVKMTVYVPDWVNPGVQLRVLPLNDAPAGSPAAVMVTASPSGSEAAIPNCKSCPSLTALLPIAPRTGARFTLLTITRIVSESVDTPSETVKVTTYTPACVKLGVHENTWLPKLAPAMSLVAVAENVKASPSGSEAAIPNCKSCPSLTALLPMGFRTGAPLGLTLLTVMVIVSESASEPSLAVKMTVYVPDWVNPGVQLRVLPLNDAPAGSPAAVMVTASPSGSEAAIPNCKSCPSLTALLPIAPRTGARFTLLTITRIVSESVDTPSETVKVTTYTPACVKLGVHENTWLPKLAPAMSLVAVAENVKASPSGSEAAIPNCKSCPSLTALLPMGFRTGAPLGLTLLTVMVIVSESASEPSLA